MVVCVKHWPPKYETYKKKGHHVPVNPPSVFSVPITFARQMIFSPPRKIESRKVDAASRRECAEKKSQKRDPDLIVNWDSLEKHCDKLDVDVIKKVDRIILTDISGDPPSLIFSLTIFNDFTISCYKGFTKVPHNDLINGFTYKVEKYSQIHNVH